MKLSLILTITLLIFLSSCRMFKLQSKLDPISGSSIDISYDQESLLDILVWERYAIDFTPFSSFGPGRLHKIRHLKVQDARIVKVSKVKEEHILIKMFPQSEGLTQMSFEARVDNRWQPVIYNVKVKKSRASPED